MSAADVQLAAERIRRGASHRHLVLLCDFDGTLSEFDNDPTAVWLKPSRRDLLERLAQGPGQTVAIVSGRRLHDVKERTALAGDVYYAGLHGLEIESSREHYLHPGLPRAEAALRALAGPLAAELATIDGAFLEDKTHALVAHFRASTAEGAQQAEDMLLRHAKRDLDAGRLRVMRGASMIELMPNIDWHKGSAVQWILDRVTPLRGPAWPVYIGDDLTDEDGFRAVEDIGLSIAASARATGADLAVDGPSEVEALLRAIAPRQG